VKNMDAYQFDEHVNFSSSLSDHAFADIGPNLQSWTFRHPLFRADRREALENIKRKGSGTRRGRSAEPSRTLRSQHTSSESTQDRTAIESLQSQIDRLTQLQEAMTAQVGQLLSDSQLRVQRQEKLIESLLTLISENCCGELGLLYLSFLEMSCVSFSMEEAYLVFRKYEGRQNDEVQSCRSKI
jgi:hypothetical protein